MTIRRFSWRFACLGLAITVLWGIYAMARPVDEVVLSIGESYEQVRRQSHSTLPAIEFNANWGGSVSRLTRLHFVDPQFGFVTPAAKFLAVHYDSAGNVDSVSLSPQAATLPLDDAMAILVDLQAQLRRGGWKPFRGERSQPIEDTPARRAEIRKVLRSDKLLAGRHQVSSLAQHPLLSVRRPPNRRALPDNTGSRPACLRR